MSAQFECCGYLDAQTPPFIKDKTCPNVLAAARIGPCIGPFSSFANNLLDIVFTAMFGLVGEFLRHVALFVFALTEAQALMLWRS